VDHLRADDGHPLGCRLGGRRQRQEGRQPCAKPSKRSPRQRCAGHRPKSWRMGGRFAESSPGARLDPGRSGNGPVRRGGQPTQLRDLASAYWAAFPEANVHFYVEANRFCVFLAGQLARGARFGPEVERLLVRGGCGGGGGTGREPHRGRLSAQRWTGSRRAFHASMPPARLRTWPKPAWRRIAPAVAERAPARQITTTSRPR
jgi:hypothetical protein